MKKRSEEAGQEIGKPEGYRLKELCGWEEECRREEVK